MLISRIEFCRSSLTAVGRQLERTSSILLCCCKLPPCSPFSEHERIVMVIDDISALITGI